MQVLAEVRRAARRLHATPLFTVFAVLSLGFGVGVTTAVYSVVQAIFLKDAGVADPQRLLFVVTPYDGRMLTGSISLPDFQDLRAAQTSFASVSAAALFTPAVAAAAGTELVPAEAVEGAYFSTAGVAAALGRTIQPADDERGARVAVLSHGLWRSRFAADPRIAGRSVRISGVPFEIIGVAPASFEGASAGLPRTRLWIPLSAEASLPHAAAGVAQGPRDRRRLLVFGRLAPSITAASASAEVSALAARLDAAFPPRGGSNRTGPSERPWKAKSLAAITSDDNILRRFGRTLVALVALVLVVACTNLANLVLARGTARQHELTVRYALGAPRWRLVCEQSIESLLLSIGGAAVACVVFQTLCVLLDTDVSLALPMGGRWTISLRPSVSGPALAVAAASLLASLAVFGLEPALQLTRSPDIRDGLAAGATALGNPRRRRQRTLLRWQVAVSAGFFVVATMFLKYTIAEARHESGVQLDGLAVAVIDFRAQQWDARRARRALDRVQEELRRDTGVSSLSVSTSMPFGVAGRMPVVLAGEHPVTGIAASPGIFTTLGVPILRGRGFDARDVAESPPILVMSSFTARRVFGEADPVGQPVTIDARGRRIVATVVGVARDTDVGRISGEPRPLVYLPLAQHDERAVVTLAARSGDATAAARALREALRRVDADLAVDTVGSARSILTGPHVFFRAAGTAALGLGTATLLLAMVGLFGIQSHAVGQRTREIGVRMSLGATAQQIRWMVVVDGYRPVLDGLLLGLVAGIAGRVVVRGYLDADVNVVDAWMLLVALPLIVAAAAACYLPARRAASVEPNVALRHL
jgi:predicted permease